MRRNLAYLVLGMAIGAAPAGARQSPAPVAASAPAPAPAMTVTPLNGQSAEKTALDQAECQNGATQASGFVPGSAPPVVAAPPPVSGKRVAGAARGAAAGAVVGEIQDNDYPNAPEGLKDEHRENQAKTGAALGVMAGGARTRQARRQSAQAQQAATQQHSAAEASWNNSYKACLTQRGYSIAG